MNQLYGFTVQAHSLLSTDATIRNTSLSVSLFDTEGHARRAYDAKDGTLVLIRPDGYVGFIANDDSLSGVEAYLDTCLHRNSTSTN
jgi:hypothetical protein